MKVLFINDGIHLKNLNSIQKYTNISLTQIYDINEIKNMDLNNFDCVFSPCNPIEEQIITRYQGVLFFFGPHFFVFPNENNKLQVIKGSQDKLNKNVYIPT